MVASDTLITHELFLVAKNVTMPPLVFGRIIYGY